MAKKETNNIFKCMNLIKQFRMDSHHLLFISCKQLDFDIKHDDSNIKRRMLKLLAVKCLY